MLTPILLGLNALLLLAIFGMMVLRYVENLEGEPPKSPWYLRVARSATRLVLEPSIETWRFLNNDGSLVEATLTDGTVWEGMGKWWWDKDNGKNAPAYVHQLLSQSNHARRLGYETV